MYKRCLALLFFSSTLFASPESSCRRIQAHLLIGNPKAACSEAMQALEAYPKHEAIYKMVIKSLASSGDDAEMMRIWEEFKIHFPESAFERDVIEEMCWGILQKGWRAPGITSQLISVIGSALTQDSHATRFLMEGMRHSNVKIRSIAVQLGSLYGDGPFRAEILRLFKEETVLDVRLEVIKAVGQLHLEELMPDLMHMVADSKRGAREKLAAIESIVHMRERINREELEVLATSKRAGLRELAVKAIAHCQMYEAIDLVIPLLRDTHPDVVVAALTTLGLLHVEQYNNKPLSFYIKPIAFNAIDPQVGITASWALLISDPTEGERAFRLWLQHEKSKVRALAASAITASGHYGIPLAKEMIQKTEDPYVRVNLALALIGQREDCQAACSVIDVFLHESKDKWMMEDEGIFQPLQKSSLSHHPVIPNYPEAVNQTVRLQMVNLLAILEYPGALSAIKDFLVERQWGVTGLAAETLLSEGDETAVTLVRTLLEDPDKTIRTESALVLAVWGRDPAALETLMKLYPEGDRQLKIKILESLGRLGGKDAIPFLVERLKESSLVLKMIAASVLIQTLNH